MPSEDYLRIQKKFWNVDEHTARFGRVDTVSRSEEEYNRLADRDLTLVLEGINVQPGWTVLEVGCGVGRLISRFRERISPTKIIGVDIAENMIGFARKALADASNVELHVNTGADLSIVTGSTVDFVYSNDVFIHIADVTIVSRYFSEIYRVLRPGGIFRFNVRRMQLNRMFSNSLGGLMAKIGYGIGLLSPLAGYKRGAEGFNGIHYRETDLRKLACRTGLLTADIRPLDDDDERKLWCTCYKRPLRSAYVSQ